MAHTQRVILTPRAALARSIQHQHAVDAATGGDSAWDKPAVLSVDAWLINLHELWAMQTPSARVPLNQHQTKLLWQRAIGEDTLIGASGLTRLATRAWQTIHEYALTPPDQWPETLLNDDQRAFKRWAKRYQQACQQEQVSDFFTDLSALAQACLSRDLPVPESITLYGFVSPLKPAHQRILDALAECGSSIVHQPSQQHDRAEPLSIQGCANADDEIIRAAHWAREHLKAHPKHRLAIVVPELSQRAASVERLLRLTLDPLDACLASQGRRPWHLVHGQSLGQLPMIRQSLAILGLRCERISQPRIHQLAQSPWLHGWPEEATQRHRLVDKLQAHEPHWVDVSTGIRYAHQNDCPEFAKRLSHWQQQQHRSPKVTHTDAWAEQFQEELSAIGFGFGRALDSTEHQTLNQWHHALENFSQLSATSAQKATRYRRDQALALLSMVTQDTIVHEQNPGAPIAVLSVEDAYGSHFDAVWLTGVDEDHWPTPPQRIPLIPNAVQRNIETSTPEGCVAQASRQLQALMTLAPVVQASHALGEEDWPLKPTRLITANHSCNTIAHESRAPLWTLPPVRLEVIENDTKAPPLTSQGITAGGMRLLNDQSTCPFKAFAVHRLKATHWQLPQPGIGPKDRGILMHQALDAFWAEVVDSTQLASLGPETLKQCVGAHVDDVLNRYQNKHPAAMDEMSRDLERDNLISKILEWLAIEKKRPEFTVIKREEETTLTIGPLTLKGKPDRIDETAAGEQLIIDYKTGNTTKSDWSPSGRLPDGQLPAYALNLKPPAQAIAFGKLAKAQVSLDGLSARDLEIPGVTPIEKANRGPFKPIKTWPELINVWRDQLAELADEFHRGHAPVAPVKPQVCQRCHLQPLCRIGQRRGHAHWEADGDDEGMVE